MKNLLITLSILLVIMAQAQNIQVVSLTTGTEAIGNSDLKWKVKIPGKNYFQDAIVSNGKVHYFGQLYTSWATNTCGQWISPYTITNSGASFGAVDYTLPNGNPIGDYEYKLTFDKEYNCNISSATINLSKVGADDNLKSITVNGVVHNLSNIKFNPLSSIASLSLAPSEIQNTNTIIFKVYNDGGWTGMFSCGNLTINYSTSLTGSITGNSSFCTGNVTLTGSTTGVVTNHYWEMIQCNASGTPTPGGYTSSRWIAGLPGIYTFPTGYPCNTYYRIKLALQNQCVNWSETTKIVYVSCSPAPSVNVGPDINVCTPGQLVYLGSGTPVSGFTYKWTLNGNNYASGSPRLGLYANATNTYVLTVTQNATGCSAIDAATVNVYNTDPTFTLVDNYNPRNISPATDDFYGLTATPTNNNISNIPGFGYSWKVEQINYNTQATIVGSEATSTCWSNSFITSFNGYDSPLFNSSGQNPMSGGCFSPNVGYFHYNSTYKITRATWSNSCPRREYSLIFYILTNPTDPTEIIKVVEVMDKEGQHTTSIKPISKDINNKDLIVSPNPSSGLFNIKTNPSDKGFIEVFDMLGNKVQTIELKNNTTDYTLDLSAYAKGIYMLNMISNNQTTTQKIIVE